MAVSTKYVITQLPVLRGMAQAALASLRAKSGGGTIDTPGPWIEEEMPPRPADLVRDYVRHTGGDPGWYKGTLPAHFFPQWAFPLAARALAVLPYPLAKIVNAGCRMEMLAPIPAHEALQVRARIESINDDGQRALITQRIETGTKSAPLALVTEMRAYVPLQKKGASGENKTPKARALVPVDALEIAFSRIPANAGLDFAKLTGDFNPIHWIPAYARAAGFRSCILHGFSTLARAIEAVNRARLVGDPGRLKVVETRFTRPLVLPARVGVYVGKEAAGLWVGDAPGGGAYLAGEFQAEGLT